MGKKQQLIILIKKRLKIGAIFFLALAFLTLLWQCSQLQKTSLYFLDQEGKEQVLTLSIKERGDLFYFMRELFARDNFAYPIFGKKPLAWSWCGGSLTFSLSSFYDPIAEYQAKMAAGLKVWKKCSHLFPNSPLWVEHYKEGASIFLVNEIEFQRVIDENKKEFEEVLGVVGITGHGLLELSKGEAMLYQTLQSHQLLWGIVLGYGVDNARAFDERCKKRIPLECVWGGFKDEMIENLKMRSKEPTIEETLRLEALPIFAGYPFSEESLALKKSYIDTQQRVIAYYKDKDFLEATLSLLSGFRPDQQEPAQPSPPFCSAAFPAP